jgi:hypothetical protein
MVMWKLKTCPRCQGDLFIDKDFVGWYEQCLQCGFRRELKALVEPKQKQPVPETERLPSSGVDTPEKRRSVKAQVK